MWVFRRAELPIVSQEETELSDWKVRLALISKPNLRLLFFPHKPWLAEPCLGDVSPWAGKLPDLQTNHFMVRTPKSAAVISRGALSLPAPGELWSLRCVLEMPQSFLCTWQGMGWEEGRSCVGHTQHRLPMETVAGMRRSLTSTRCFCHPQIYCHFHLSLKKKPKKRERYLQFSLQNSILLGGMTKRTEQNCGNRIEV